jgi:hypothetical protein
MNYHLNYKGPVNEMIGRRLKHPVSGIDLIVTNQEYNGKTNKTRLTLEPVPEILMAGEE